MEVVVLQSPVKCSDCGALIPAGAEARSYPGGKLYHKDSKICRDNKAKPAAPDPAAAAAKAPGRAKARAEAVLQVANAINHLLDVIEEERK